MTFIIKKKNLPRSCHAFWLIDSNHLSLWLPHTLTENNQRPWGLAAQNREMSWFAHSQGQLGNPKAVTAGKLNLLIFILLHHQEERTLDISRTLRWHYPPLAERRHVLRARLGKAMSRWEERGSRGHALFILRPFGKGFSSFHDYIVFE